MNALDDPITRIRDASIASVNFMAEHRSYFALLETEQLDPAAAAVLRESSAVYMGDVERLILEAQRIGQITDDADTNLLALAVLSAVSQFSHFHRTGRIDRPADEVARFVGDWIVSGLATASRDAKRG